MTINNSKVAPSDEKVETTVPNLISPHHLGVWTVLTGHRTGSFLRFNYWKTISTTARSLSRVMKDVYQLSPGLLLLYILAYVWECISDTVLLFFSGRLLRILEIGLKEGKVDPRVVLHAFAARILCQAFDSLVKWQA
jgi:hypothetical protein